MKDGGVLRNAAESELTDKPSVRPAQPPSTAPAGGPAESLQTVPPPRLRPGTCPFAACSRRAAALQCVPEPKAASTGNEERRQLPMPRKLIIDCDPGIDDAVALCLALFDPRLEVLAVTAVEGNVSAAQASVNVQAVIDYLDPPRSPRLGAATPCDSPPGGGPAAAARRQRLGQPRSAGGATAPSAPRGKDHLRRGAFRAGAGHDPVPGTADQSGPRLPARSVAAPAGGSRDYLRRQPAVHWQRDSGGGIQHVPRSAGGPRRVPLGGHPHPDSAGRRRTGQTDAGHHRAVAQRVVAGGPAAAAPDPVRLPRVTGSTWDWRTSSCKTWWP